MIFINQLEGRYMKKKVTVKKENMNLDDMQSAIRDLLWMIQSLHHPLRYLSHQLGMCDHHKQKEPKKKAKKSKRNKLKKTK